MSAQSPKYLQLKEEILSWIASGKYRPGDKLPSENELAEQYSLSRQTVRQSIGELVTEGWLAREQGKGTFVSRQSPERRSASGNRTVGVITTSISDYIFPSIVRGIEATLKEKGYRMLLSSTDHRKDRERECLEMMLSHSVCALIVEPTKSAEGNPNFDNYLAIEDHGIPMVMINESYPDMEFPSVRVDDDAGGFMAASYVIGLGHRRVAGFFKTDDLQGVRRMKGFIRACREHHIPSEASMIVRYSTEDKGEHPHRMLREMLMSDQSPTALVCYNDQLAISLLDTVREIGLRVPEDLSIIGYDDSFLATATEIKLTTIEHPKSGLGEQAANLLIAQMEKGTAPPNEEMLYPPKLIVRQSTMEIQ
ncbi:GntR family transcriptional regulator [Cohnella cholangitidis]|uniref:GntR family transcriptional regulator n=1 Tax=Cohnella cholangitidis TaxID=2598458 RepID=A0A7G5C1R8_9BACL|nr:GntR family transcriptional regulator [Cohnella cholangitidis]QMV43152.1 GntR family transcriptional regulator [Cohnella cholangitidis]